MMNFLERILRMPRVVLTVMALLLFAGFGAYMSLPKESFPAIDIPYFYVSVTQSGSYRVNDRELINSSPDTLRAAIVEVAGADRDKPVTVRADGRATHQSVVSAMDVLGKLGFVRLNIATVEDSAPKK